MAMTTTVRHHTSVDLRHACSVETSLVATEHATEIYVRLAPVASGTSRNACHIQARVLYDALDELLHGLNAQPHHVLVEKAYFRNLPCDHDDFDQIRREFYRKRGLVNGCMPAITHVGQAPCQPGVDVELQIFGLIPSSPDSVAVHTLPSPREHLSVKVVEVGQARHLYLSNVTGESHNGDGAGSFREQSDRMFQAVAEVLAENGLSFNDVLRSWIYLSDIATDYSALNSSRNTFFAGGSVTRLPANTAIGAQVHPAGAKCAMDAYALLTPEAATIEVMSAPTLNEAAEYGAAFSRGMKMILPESTYLFLSATASIDEKGETVHNGDVRGQIERMLINVNALLEAQGAGWSDVTHAVSYLQSPGDLELYRELCAERGIADVPHTIVCAERCRSELLCEMEAVAVIRS